MTEIHCTYDPASKGGNSPDGRKVKGTIHWVPAPYAKKAEIRLYENIVDEELGVYNEDGSLNLNPNSLTVLENCYVEPFAADAKAYDSFQFVRQGYLDVYKRQIKQLYKELYKTEDIEKFRSIIISIERNAAA